MKRHSFYLFFLTRLLEGSEVLIVWSLGNVLWTYLVSPFFTPLFPLEKKVLLYPRSETSGGNDNLWSIPNFFSEKLGNTSRAESQPLGPAMGTRPLLITLRNLPGMLEWVSVVIWAVS